MDEKRNAAQEWLETATKSIRFKPDRLAVEAELREHLEDKTADMARIFHIEGEEAEQEVLKRMGDPDEIGKKLAQVHKPWLGYLWMASRVLLIILLILAVFYMRILDHYGDNVRGGFGYLRSLQSPLAVEPAQVERGNYTFRVVEAFMDSDNTILVTVRASSPRFWERIAMLSDRQVSVILKDGTRIDLDARFSEDEKAVSAYASLYDTWHIFSRDIWIYIHNTPCQIGDWVTVEMRFPLGTVTLSAQISEGRCNFGGTLEKTVQTVLGQTAPPGAGGADRNQPVHHRHHPAVCLGDSRLPSILSHPGVPPAGAAAPAA